MVWSKKVAITGLIVGVIGVIQGREVVELGAFVIIAASCVCRAVENASNQSQRPHLGGQLGKGDAASHKVCLASQSLVKVGAPVRRSPAPRLFPHTTSNAVRLQLRLASAVGHQTRFVPYVAQAYRYPHIIAQDGADAKGCCPVRASYQRSLVGILSTLFPQVVRVVGGIQRRQVSVSHDGSTLKSEKRPVANTLRPDFS